MAITKQKMQTSQDTNVKTSVFEKISYGMGDVACNVVFALTSGLITYFYIKKFIDSNLFPMRRATFR